MIRSIYRRTLTVALIGAWVLLGHRAQGQGLPKGEDLLDKYVTVTGGKEAYEKCKNRLTQGTMEFAGAGIKGELTMYQTPPNKMYLEANFQGLGKFEQGTDGQTVWERNAIAGARLLQGEEKAAHLRQALFNEDVDWRKAYKKAECVGEETIDGKPCYKVILTPAEGQVVTKYFDKESGLAVKTMTTMRTQMGNLPTEVLYSDYKKVDGILFPHKLQQKALTQQIVVTVDKLRHNVDMPANRFDLPEDIKKLAEKDKKDDGKNKK